MPNVSVLMPEDPYYWNKQYDRQKQSAAKKKKVFQFVFELFIVGAVMYLLFGVLFGIAIVQEDSMSPTVPSGSFIFFCRLLQNPQDNQIVIFNAGGGKQLIKRVVATSGQTVNIKSNLLYINGRQETGSYASGNTTTEGSILQYPYKVPPEFVFVLGDNRSNSVDSRRLGSINKRRLTGTAIFVFKHP